MEMNSRILILTLFAAFSSAAGFAAEYLMVITSEVYQAPGTPRALATRANTCIAQKLIKGSSDDPLIISTDLENGVIVARNSIEYGSLPRWKIRSRFTFEAREGRFRVEQTNLERFNTSVLTGVESWGPIGKWTGSRWREVTIKFEESASTVANCVISGSGQQKDW